MRIKSQTQFLAVYAFIMSFYQEFSLTWFYLGVRTIQYDIVIIGKILDNLQQVC